MSGVQCPLDHRCALGYVDAVRWLECDPQRDIGEISISREAIITGIKDLLDGHVRSSS